VEYGARLNDALTALGMGVAFDDQRADLSGIADVGSRRLYISRVDQKAFVEVNEEGTEAAAATNVGVGLTSAPPSMIVDRPFLFMIRERFSGTIMFVGLVQRLGA
jgi:serpin B